MENKCLTTLVSHFDTTQGTGCIAKPAFVDTKKQVYYYLSPKGNNYHLEFWIDTYADKRGSLQKRLKDIFSEESNHYRDYCLVSYYSALGIHCRRPIITRENLEDDFAALQKMIEPIETEIQNAGSGTSVSVGIGNISIVELLKNKLYIPDYQRPYCWNEKNVLGLLEDIHRWQNVRAKNEKTYRIGTVILKQRSDETLDVIDGQQRIITLAILAAAILAATQDSAAMNVVLGSSNQTKQAIDTINATKKIVENWTATHKIDLENVMVGVVVIGTNESDDLSFNFFNHLNSSGVPLTDYELLKGHHLRYVKDDSVAEIMARRWHELDTGKIEKCKEYLLHRCLFRIRKWLARKEFPANADHLETHSLFKEFSLGFEPLSGLCTPYRPTEIDSLLSGGIEFFDYVEKFRKVFEAFMTQPAAKALESLRGHSHGTLYDGILALSFLFYYKFGDIYLNEAVYAIAWVVSRIRNEHQIRRAYIGNRSEFRTVAMVITKATHEGEVLGSLLNPQNTYSVENKGKTAVAYWKELGKIAEALQGANSTLVKNNLSFIDTLTKQFNKE